MQGVGGRGQNIASGSLSVFLSVYSKISTKVETLLELRANYLGSQEFSAHGILKVRFDLIAQILLIIQLETQLKYMPCSTFPISSVQIFSTFLELFLYQILTHRH